MTFYYCRIISDNYCTYAHFLSFSRRTIAVLHFLSPTFGMSETDRSTYSMYFATNDVSNVSHLRGEERCKKDRAKLRRLKTCNKVTKIRTSFRPRRETVELEYVSPTHRLSKFPSTHSRIAASGLHY